MSGPARRPREAGFSLVEVIVALGLLAAVLVAISGIFTLANHQLEGGRHQTTAIAVARDILEEVEGYGFRETWTAFGYDGTASSYVVDSRSHVEAAEWQTALDAGLSGAWAELRISSVAEGTPKPALRDAGTIRIEVTVHWTDGPRERFVRLATVRV